MVSNKDLGNKSPYELVTEADEDMHLLKVYIGFNPTTYIHVSRSFYYQKSRKPTNTWAFDFILHGIFEIKKAGNRNRTGDLRTTNATHYRLCYTSNILSVRTY